MTSTSMNKYAVLFTLTLFFTSIVAGVSYNSEGFFGDAENYEIPEYESHGQIFSQLVAPFLFVTIILQLGLNKVLQFTLAENNNPYRDEEDPEIRRNATIMSLIIGGMMVPTPIFNYVQIATTAIFGSIVAVFAAVIGYTALIMLKETF